jgi:hypothetical protein
MSQIGEATVSFSHYCTTYEIPMVNVTLKRYFYTYFPTSKCMLIAYQLKMIRYKVMKEYTLLTYMT